MFVAILTVGMPFAIVLDQFTAGRDVTPHWLKTQRPSTRGVRLRPSRDIGRGPERRAADGGTDGHEARPAALPLHNDRGASPAP